MTEDGRRGRRTEEDGGPMTGDGGVVKHMLIPHTNWGSMEIWILYLNIIRHPTSDIRHPSSVLDCIPVFNNPIHKLKTFLVSFIKVFYINQVPIFSQI